MQLKRDGFDLVLASVVLFFERVLTEFRSRRRRRENALRVSEERFRALMQFSSDVYWETDAMHRFSRREVSDRLGGAVVPAAMIGKTPWEIPYLAPDEETWIKHRATLDAHLPFRDFELARPSATGGTRYFSVSGVPAFDASGRFVGYWGIGRDITKRKSVEAELRASEERFRTFVDRATDAFYLLDERVRIVDVNQQACAALGWSRDELIGMHPREFDAGLDDTSIGRINQRVGAGETITFETRHRRKDGSVFPVEVRTGTFERGGKRFHLALARDISERQLADEELRATEARFRTLVEAAADSFMLHAADSTVIDVNRQACENLGYSRQELIGMKPADFDVDLDAEAMQRVAERISPGEIITIETHHRRKDGTVFPVELRLRQVVQGGQRLTISLARDITERKRVEEERERRRLLEIELARVSRLTTLGELTASIAHEVSQPLGGMVASAGACARWLAAEPPAIAEAHAALANIVADGKRARDVIARIRALSRRQALRQDPLDINYKIAEVLALTEHELRRHGIVLRKDLARTLPRVTGDPVQLQQVLLNLIMNAIDAMHAVHDRARELTIVSRADGSDRVLVEVRDSGIGLDPQRTEQLFEAFYTTKPEGIGIGLSISRSIIEAHGGRLWANANALHGAVFSFALPVAEEKAS
jgi:PAS domain S-box-containing protein